MLLVGVLAMCGLALLPVLEGCKDMGTEPQTGPVILGIVPDSASAGDTVAVIGSGFGAAQGSSYVNVGGVRADTCTFWSSGRVHFIVPASAVLGRVSVVVKGQASNAVSLRLIAAAAPVSFVHDILPIFRQWGCYACHGGSGGLVVHTVASLLQGGMHGPAIVPGNADASLIIQKTSPSPPFGDRMPQGGPYLDNATILVIRAWINQGAKDN